VDVFQVEQPFELAGTDFIQYLCEALANRSQVVCGDDAAGFEHGGVGERALNIEFRQALVEFHRSGVAL